MNMELNLYENRLIFSESEDSGSDEEIMNNVIRKQYTVRPRPDLWNEYDNIEFFRRFRFQKETVEMILGLIGRRIQSRTDRRV